ncbi:YesL family protein [Bacillus sp. J37]|uniref:YesL family protein n=1 Tax=Bacillus sp. J37 TaxID=935837 RepID=UPI00047C108A|nr:YesL family protein [Bacillus sp. J37]
MGKVLNITKFYLLLEWVMWLAYINLLWIGSALIGLIVFGIFPATVAMFTVIRHLLLKDTTGKQILKTFALTYKREFFKSNVIGLIFTAIGYLLYLDFLYIQNMTGTTYYMFQIGLIFISIIYFISLLYIVPVYVHYDLKFHQYFRHALLIGILSPITTMLIVIGLTILYFLLVKIPGLIPLITTSTLAFIIMGCALNGFRRLEDKQQSAKSTL